LEVACEKAEKLVLEFIDWCKRKNPILTDGVYF
jgi:hypothetical protein